MQQGTVTARIAATNANRIACAVLEDIIVHTAKLIFVRLVDPTMLCQLHRLMEHLCVKWDINFSTRRAVKAAVSTITHVIDVGKIRFLAWTADGLASLVTLTCALLVNLPANINRPVRILCLDLIPIQLQILILCQHLIRIRRLFQVLIRCQLQILILFLYLCLPLILRHITNLYAKTDIRSVIGQQRKDTMTEHSLVLYATKSFRALQEGFHARIAITTFATSASQVKFYHHTTLIFV